LETIKELSKERITISAEQAFDLGLIDEVID